MILHSLPGTHEPSYRNTQGRTSWRTEQMKARPKFALLTGIDEYSGPGLTDLRGSLFDECLVLGRRDGKLNHLRDVEIAFLLDQIADKGATGGRRSGKRWGTGIRRVPGRTIFVFNWKLVKEYLENALRLPPNDASRGASRVQHWMTASEGINFLAAYQPKQKAQEMPPIGGTHFFTRMSPSNRVRDAVQPDTLLINK
ncbi:hypothetical protein ACQRIT_000641 [Beauveria bassiana]